MAEEELHFGVTLEDHMSGPAHEAAKSLHELGKGAEHGKSLIDELSKGFVKVVEPAEVLKGAFEGVSKGLGSFANGLKAGEAKEMVSGLAESLGGLASMLDLVYPGLGQIASAVIKAGGAFASFTVGLTQAGAELAIEASHAKASLIDTFAALGGGLEVGRETEEMLADLSHKIGITRDALAPFAKSFMAMGIEGKEALEKVTLAAASAQAIMSDPSAANAFVNLEKKIQVAVQTGHGLKIPAKGLGSLADMGIRVDEVARRMNLSSKALADQLKAGTVNARDFGDALQSALVDKGAGPLARMGSSFGNLKKMFGQSIDEMFEDMSKATEPFLKALGNVLHDFDQSTASGRAMKTSVGTAFTYIFGVATKAIVPIEQFFLRTMILSVKVYKLIKLHWTEIRATFASVQPTLDLIAASFAQMEKGVNAVMRLDAALRSLKGGGDIGTMGQPAGRNFADGLADGIKSGIPGVKAAADSLAVASKKAVDTSLDNHSPSRAMFKSGAHGSAGLALGLRAGATGVTASARGVALGAVRTVGTTLRTTDYTPRRGGDRATPRGGAGGGGGNIQGGIHVTIQAPNGVTNAIELTETAIALVFERLALQQGR